MGRVEERVLQAVAKEAMWAPGETVVVAVSGGADSLCLLHILHTHQSRHGGVLHVAHLDHCFRGAVSAQEAAQVSELARSLALPATVGQEDVPALVEQGGRSPEEAARVARYRFLVGVAADVGAAVIALGHTEDDQVETVLMHLLRGSGLQGLQGMWPLSSPAPWMLQGLALPRPPRTSRSNREGLQLARPLLGVRRSETALYCRWAGLIPAEDAWNQDPRFLRARLRQEVIPLLRTINPQFEEALLRLARLAGWAEQDLQAMLLERWGELATGDGGKIVLNLALWVGLSWTLRLLALRRAVGQVRGHVEGLGWEAVVAAGQLDAMAVGSEVALVEDVIVRRGYDCLEIGPRWAIERSDLHIDRLEEPLPVQIPGRTVLPDGRILAVREMELGPELSQAAPWESAGPGEAWVDAERCGRRLWLRHRRPGDRFQPFGMRAQKKLQDFFVDEKVPRAEREQVPLLVSPEGIVWIVGYRLDERFRVRPGTRQVLHLRWGVG